MPIFTVFSVCSRADKNSAETSLDFRNHNVLGTCDSWHEIISIKYYQRKPKFVSIII
jgi:hypothetical protein